MYYVIPAKAANAALAKKFIDFAESPEVQAQGIVKQFNWYPGIDPQYVQSKMSPTEWNKLFTDITPAQLEKNGRPFPLSQYFTDIVEGYERVVLK
jgi:ABC-type glycerol-3-phosphate transport system substrate-binding protein